MHQILIVKLTYGTAIHNLFDQIVDLTVTRMVLLVERAIKTVDSVSAKKDGLVAVA